MLKKGKFKLLSYILDKNLIFYKSENRNKKYLGFFGLHTSSFYPLISILNNLLEKRYIKYYSIQVNTKNVSDYLYLVNIETNSRNEIIKLWNLTKEKIEANCNDLIFLDGDMLEKTFLEILDDNFSNNSLITKNKNIELITDNKIKIFEVYKINFENLEDKVFFLESFLSYIDNLNIFGYFILNFQLLIDDSIKIFSYFTVILENKENKTNIMNEVNAFFNIPLLEKKEISIKKIGLLLWRYPLFNNNYSFKDLSDLFKKKNYNNFEDIHQFNHYFEQMLKKMQINYARINENMLFIFKNVLFITFFECDPKILLKIFKKYYSKYMIYLLVFNEIDLNELLRMEIDLLRNVKILNINDFFELDLLVFRNNN